MIIAGINIFFEITILISDTIKMLNTIMARNKGKYKSNPRYSHINPTIKQFAAGKNVCVAKPIIKEFIDEIMIVTPNRLESNTR